MRTKILPFLLTFILTVTSLPQNSIDELPEVPAGYLQELSELKNSLINIRTENNHQQNQNLFRNDLIIGQSDPNETVTITGNYFLDGNLIIVNNGQLILDNADFKIKGDIQLFNNGKLNAGGGSFTVIQEYIYEHEAVLWNSSEFTFDSVSFTSGGQSWSIAVNDSAIYNLSDSEITDGFITTGMSGIGSAVISNTKTPGEFLCLGKNNIQFTNSDFLLMWLVLPDSSIVDVSLPDDSLIINWQFEEALPGVSGIPYSLSIDSCTNVMWGLISMSGSDATFTNTKFRTSGLFFSDPDSITVSNITNNSTHFDDVINVPDRNLRMVNTEVQTWNFYPAVNSNIKIENCVFGELLSLDSSSVTIENSVCDGSGGYLGAIGNSFLIVTRSLISSQVIARENGFLIGALSAFNSPEIDADDNGIMAILNTSTFVEPEAHNSAIIFEELLPPVEGFTESDVLIEGTARILSGPLNTIEFESYSVYYSDDLQNPAWQPVAVPHLEQVVNDTLDVWNTNNLPAGPYVLMLSINHSLGDSVPLISNARLKELITEIEKEKRKITGFQLEQNFPNPFNPSTKIKFSVQKDEKREMRNITLKVFDVLGNEVAALVNKELPPGEYEIDFDASNLTSGIYFYQLKAENYIKTKKMILIR